MTVSTTLQPLQKLEKETSGQASCQWCSVRQSSLFFGPIWAPEPCLSNIFPSRTLGNLTQILRVVLHVSVLEDWALVFVALGYCRKCCPGAPLSHKHLAGPWTAVSRGILGSSEFRILSGTSVQRARAVDVVSSRILGSVVLELRGVPGTSVPKGL